MKNYLKYLVGVIIFLTQVHSNTLTVYNWNDYIDEEILKDFTAQTGIGLNYKIYENNDELHQILKDKKSCDIVFPSRYYFKLLRSEGHLQKIDLTKIHDLDKIDPFLLNQKATKGYGLPYFWGSTSVVYNKRLIPFSSIKDLWKENLRNKIVITNDMRDMFAFALTSIGLSPNSENEEDIKKAYQRLVELIPNIVGFNNNTDKISLWLNNENIYAAIAYNGDTEEVLNENFDLEFIYPTEGAIIWMDFSAICAGSQNLDNVYQFLNYLYDDTVIEKNTEKLGYLPPTRNQTNINKATYPNRAEKENAIEIVKIDKAYDTYEMYWNKFLDKLKLKGISSED